MRSILDLLGYDVSSFGMEIFLGILFILFIFLRANNFNNKYLSFHTSLNTPQIPEKDIDITKNSIHLNKFSDKIVFFLRRNRALRKCKKFLTKTNYLIKLKNQFLSISYLTEKKVITCQELNKEKRVLTIDWKTSSENEYEYKSINNIFEKMFDNICLAFNEKTTYDNIAPIFKNYFKTKEEITNPKKKEENKEVKNEEQELKKIELKNFEKTIVDINKANENELTKLAGITIVKAKQIIQYRDLHKGFKSKEEFFEQMKIKKHFKMQQYEYIVLSEYEIEENEKQEERILDF